MARTYPLIWPHLEAVRSYLDTQMSFPVTHWRAPVNATTEADIDPPYAMIRIFPSAEQFDGPLDDSQADIIVRFQIQGIGIIEEQALKILDEIRPHMQRGNFTIANRHVQDVRLMVVTGGVSRDDDIPSSILYAQDLYLIQTTPA